MRYLVIATKWDNKSEKQIKYIAGQFDEYTNAIIFTSAYNNAYMSDAKVLDTQEIINK